MKLSKIISEKRKEEVYTIEDTATLTQAAKLFCEHRIGALLVERDGAIVGIITERDIIRICSYEAEFYNIKVSELMTEDIVYCNVDCDIHDALKIMARHKIRHIPITDNGNVVGVISIGELIQELYKESEATVHDIADLTGSNSRNKVF